MRAKAILSVLIVLSFFCSMRSFGQEGLLIRNVKTGKAWMYELGSHLTYIKKGDDEYSSGQLRQLYDTAVVFGRDTVGIKSIVGIRKRTPIHSFLRVVGLPVMLIGSIIIGDGAADWYSHPDSDEGKNNILVGAGIFFAGYLPYAFNRRDFTVGIGGDWKLEIVRGSPH